MKGKKMLVSWLVWIALIIILAIFTKAPVKASWIEEVVDQAVTDIQHGSQYANVLLIDLIKQGREAGIEEWKIRVLEEHLRQPKRVIIDGRERRHYNYHR